MSGLPPSLWADAVATVSYICNFIPSAHHPGVVPVEWWTGKQQDISHLQPFGCTAYAKIPVEINVLILSPWFIKYILIGHFGHGAYKMWDWASGTIIKSCDVIFEEGQGHHTITAAPSSSFDTTFNNNDTFPPSEAPMNSSGVIIPPKSFAPHLHATDPPPHTFICLKNSP